ncbi:hypothetical protein B0H34DRAFT_238202 [Crassisporium funariophilum]|nr:hypothetical protein B0H34DRAFT_238202 [Crassisporium funariophilum]
MLSRSQFALAIGFFAQRHPHWSCDDGPRTGYGFLTRTTNHVKKEAAVIDDDETLLVGEGVDEVEDLASALPARPALTVHEYIVYSAAFNVPAFYFTVHDSNGSFVPLVDVVESSLFKFSPPDGSETTAFAITPPSAPFPLLSQGEHPTLGCPCWYLHPCETEKAVAEFISEVELPDWNEETRLVRWLDLWLMIVGSVLNL